MPDGDWDRKAVGGVRAGERGLQDACWDGVRRYRN